MSADQAAFLDDSDQSEVAATYRAFLDRHGLTESFQQAPRHKRAEWLLRHLEDEKQRRLREAEASEARGDFGRARGRRAMIERLDFLADQLFAIVHPPLIGDGSGYRVGEKPCRYCGEWIEEKTAYEQGGCCESCWAIATKQAEPPGPADQLEKEVNDLVQR